MPDASNGGLELLALLLMDLRSTVESKRRSVTNAQSSVEQFRHVRMRTHLEDIGDCLQQLRKESATIVDVATQADEQIGALHLQIRGDSDTPDAS